MVGKDGLADMATVVVHDANFTFDVELEHMSRVSEDIFHIIKPLLDKALSSSMTSSVVSSLDNLAKSLTKELLEAAALLRPSMKSTTPVPHTRAPTELDLSASLFLTSFYGLVSDVFGVRSAQFSLDNLIGIITNHSNNITVDVPPSIATLDVLSNGLLNLSLTLDQLQIKHLETIDKLDIFVQDPITIGAVLDLSHLDMSVSYTYNISVGAPLVNQPLYSQGYVALDVEQANVTGQLRVEVDRACVHQLTEIALYNPGCVQNCISAMVFEDLDLRLGLELSNTTEWTGDDGIDGVVSSLVNFVTDNFGMEADALLHLGLRKTIMPTINTAMSNYLCNQTCNNEGMGSITPTYYAAIGVGVAILAVTIYIYLLMRADNADNSAPDEQTALLSYTVLNKGYADSPHATRLCTEPHMSPWLRYIVPILLLVVTGMLVYAHTEVAGRVYPSIVYNGTTTDWSTLTVLQFIHTVHDMWLAKVYALDVTVLVLSGIWPYLKLVLMMFCWLVPTSTLSVGNRETFLRILDVIGKWSLLDIYVSIMLVVGMHFHVPLDTPTQNTPTIVNMWVTPEPALFVYWAVIILSLVLTHLMLHTHRACVQANLGCPTPILRREALCNHVFRSGSRHFRFTWGGKALIALVCLGTAGAVVLGCITDAFTFNMKGLIAWLYEQDGFSSQRTYSLWSMFWDLPAANPNPNGLAIRFVQAFYLLFACAVPLIQQLVLLVLWLTPLTAKAQRRLYIAAEILFAWSGLEVYLLSIVMALLQLQPLTHFIIGHKCDTINALLRPFLSRELDGDSVCFDVTTDINNGTFILVGCCVVNMLATLVVMRLCHQAVETRCTDGAGGVLVRTDSGTLTDMYYGSSDNKRANESGSIWTSCSLCFGCIAPALAEDDDRLTSPLNN
eukprot:TRINITY_DN11127_c0_g1_i3.p1 TRINITY_DN11127_c0_g1~~TRINITY_DN11127_c0_g1_i3.p1  ORF type:complete len:977 (+),score=222.83 TRINITY_DN11127_c0_g1_i3:236-2932(+)